MSARLDSSQEFLDISADVNAIKHLMHVIVAMADDVLRVCDIAQLDTSRMRANGYRPVLMTVEQFNAFHFLLGHAVEIATRADEAFDGLEIVARDFERRPA